jgi:hypothetical protein
MVARLRVSTSGTAAASDDYANGTATAGLFLSSGGPGLPPIYRRAAAIVNQILFVDGVNGTGTSTTGSQTDPFQTPQQAVNFAVANGWNEVQIQVAPGMYGDPILIPDTLFWTSIVGWNSGIQPSQPRTILWGDITIATGPGVSDALQIVDCMVLAANIQTAAVNQGIYLSLIRSVCAAAVQADILEVFQVDSSQTGNVTGIVSLATWFDSYSWAQKVNSGAVYAPANYTRTFRGPGENRYVHTLTINGVAIGTVGFVTVAVPDVRAGDYAELQLTAPAAIDFIAGFHSSAAGQLIFWLRNLSRASTNFAEPCESCITHADMATQV